MYVQLASSQLKPLTTTPPLISPPGHPQPLRCVVSLFRAFETDRQSRGLDSYQGSEAKYLL